MNILVIHHDCFILDWTLNQIYETFLFWLQSDIRRINQKMIWFLFSKTGVNSLSKEVLKKQFTKWSNIRPKLMSYCFCINNKRDETENDRKILLQNQWFIDWYLREFNTSNSYDLRFETKYISINWIQYQQKYSTDKSKVFWSSKLSFGFIPWIIQLIAIK